MPYGWPLVRNAALQIAHSCLQDLRKYGGVIELRGPRRLGPVIVEIWPVGGAPPEEGRVVFNFPRP